MDKDHDKKSNIFSESLSILIKTTVILLVMIFLLYLSPVKDILEVRFWEFLKFLLIVMIFIVAAIILMRYLQTGELIKKETYKDGLGDDELSFLGSPIISKIEDKLKNHDVELENISSKINNINFDLLRPETYGLALNDDQKQQLIGNLKNQIEIEGAKDFIEQIRKQLLENIKNNSELEEIENICKSIVTRLDKETSALSRRANLNLVLGILTTITGFWILYGYVSHIAAHESSPWILTTNFLPRLSLVIFIELFAYFFLKLYKSNLLEIKYFQNELTNIESKHLSLRTALVHNDSKAISSVIKSLSDTERNYILTKGQSTVELERKKIDKETVSGFTNALSQILKKLNPNK